MSRIGGLALGATVTILSGALFYVNYVNPYYLKDIPDYFTDNNKKTKLLKLESVGVERWILSDEEINKLLLPICTPSIQKPLGSDIDRIDINFPIIESAQSIVSMLYYLPKLNTFTSKHLYNILSYLPLHEVANLRLIHSSWNRLASLLINDGKYLKSCSSFGFPSNLRSGYWKYISGSIIHQSYNTELYNRVRDLISHQTDTWSHQIKIDIHRTYPDHPYFQENAPGCERLYTLLMSITLFNSMSSNLVGPVAPSTYVQGMNYIGGFLILHLDDESAFWLFHTLLTRYRMEGLFSARLPRLRLCLYQWNCLLALCLPKLYTHLSRKRIMSTMYASEWYLTLFCYRLPPDSCAYVWDLFIVEGMIALHRIGLACLSLIEDALLSLPFDGCLRELKVLKILSPERMLEILQVANTRFSNVDDEFLMSLEPFSSELDPFNERVEWEEIESADELC